ncbi:MAG: hypothetical protein LQ338_008332 [Usnochroma carphineum]|nr:MAG: hypothetical protein LQ338_008332 [Usnochroma carphineum]
MLLKEGADADTAATSKWSRDDNLGTITIFEAATTPLQIAANCSGRLARINDLDMKINKLLPDNKEFPMFNPSSWASRFSDTMRVLVENGADPMARNINGDTALHLHTGASQQFQYLLHQEEFFTDCAQLNSHGDTIAERHARWYWPEGPVRARLALEHEITERRNLCKYRSSQSPITSRTLLLHETASHLRHFFTRDAHDFESALQLVQTLVREGVDIHSVLDEGTRKNTPLAQITTIATEVEMSQEGLEEERQITNLVLDEWLRTLGEAHVDVQQYVKEEERLIQSDGIGCQWELYEFDDTWEYSAEWEFTNRTDHKSRPISIRYMCRPAPEEEEKTGSIETDWVDVPGAWIEESR